MTQSQRAGGGLLERFSLSLINVLSGSLVSKLIDAFTQNKNDQSPCTSHSVTFTPWQDLVNWVFVQY